MFGITDFLSFVIAAGLLILVPGPSFLYVMGQSGAKGMRQGVIAGLGVATGDSILMILSFIGVASLFKAFPSELVILKYVGALYLIYLGISAFVSRSTVETKKNYRKEANPFKKGLLITLLNPKAILFFMAFFPLFIDPAYEHKALTFIILAGIFQVISLLHVAVVIVAAAHVRKLIGSKQKIKSILKKLSGTLFIGFGIKLASSN